MSRQHDLNKVKRWQWDHITCHGSSLISTTDSKYMHECIAYFGF
jgi:hypothetical protein